MTSLPRARKFFRIWTELLAAAHSVASLLWPYPKQMLPQRSGFWIPSLASQVPAAGLRGRLSQILLSRQGPEYSQFPTSDSSSYMERPRSGEMVYYSQGNGLFTAPHFFWPQVHFAIAFHLLDPHLDSLLNTLWIKSKRSSATEILFLLVWDVHGLGWLLQPWVCGREKVKGSWEVNCETLPPHSGHWEKLLSSDVTRPQNGRRCWQQVEGGLLLVVSIESSPTF